MCQGLYIITMDETDLTQRVDLVLNREFTDTSLCVMARLAQKKVKLKIKVAFKTLC